MFFALDLYTAMGGRSDPDSSVQDLHFNSYNKLGYGLSGLPIDQLFVAKKRSIFL